MPLIGTLVALAQTAAANRPPDTNELDIFLITASRFGNSISPHRHSAASNDDTMMLGLNSLHHFL